MGMQITLTVPLASPSLNETSRMHWAVKGRHKRSWLALLRIAAGANRESLRASGRRHVLIERAGSRKLDYDNLVGGAKEVIVDNLRTMGLLVDDTDEWVKIEAVNIKRYGEKPYTRITLTDIGD